jgi:hypothetical protein
MHLVQTMLIHVVSYIMMLHRYEGVYKIFHTGAAIYTAVVVVQSTGRW